MPGDEQRRLVGANLDKCTCAAYSPLELAAMVMLDDLPESHPAVVRLAQRGLIVNFDERAAIEALARMTCAHSERVNLTICPTMGCNFDCPYCFENHANVCMSASVQDDVVALASRMLDVSWAKKLTVTWFGGEPLLVPDVIEVLSARLAASAEKRGATYEAQIITNGYLLTPENAQMLERAHVTKLQVTLDGVGADHDATRHLANGGPTFERIVQNLARPGLPFKVALRHNVHQGNQGEVDVLRAYVDDLAASSGNDLVYYTALVVKTDVAERRGCKVGIVDNQRASDLMLSCAKCVSSLRPLYCGAGNMWDVGIDPEGRLQKCWEAVDKPELSFGRANVWDPADPLATADTPDNLTCFLNSSQPLGDSECDSCIWLPACAGGCPYQRLHGAGRKCLPYKDDPEAYVLSLWHSGRMDGI